MVLDQSKPVIPAWLIWIQCIAFVVLYAVWALPQIVGFRNTALVLGALAGLYPIFIFRYQLLQKKAIPIWLVIGLFVWATFHMFFLSQDYAAQFLEYKRIWKYAAIGAVFAFGLGLSLASTANLDIYADEKKLKTYFWAAISFGLCSPLILYLLKYVLTMYGPIFGVTPPDYLKIYIGTQHTYSIPKTDYVAFSLPTFGIALGVLLSLMGRYSRLDIRQRSIFYCYVLAIPATLLLFYTQNIKNGMAYAVLCIGLFLLLLLYKNKSINWLRKIVVVAILFCSLSVVLYPHFQKNDTWTTIVADAKIAFQLDEYQHWKYAGEKGYPNNEFGRMVSITNYERAAWFKAGLKLVTQNPLGYGLVEDSFKRMAKACWPEVSLNLSHSHSGWLDVILGFGLPGFFLLISALFLALVQSKDIGEPWKLVVFWGLLANSLLWITTEVSATVTFATLIFWVCWSAGLTALDRQK